MARYSVISPAHIAAQSVFALLAIATLAMALALLQEEKQKLSYKNYQTSFKKTQEQVSSRLHHPAGQLALLNPPGTTTQVTIFLAVFHTSCLTPPLILMIRTRCSRR